MAQLLILIITVMIISILWFLAWHFLTDQLMNQRTTKRSRMRYIAFSTLIQLGFNLLAFYTSRYWQSYYNFALMGTFTLQGFVMWRMLYSRAKPAKAVSTVALTYFFIYATVYILENIVYSCIELMWEAVPSELAYLVFANLLNILYHALALAFSLLLGNLIKKLNFVSYYGNLFNRPVWGWVVCGISLILMHSQNLLPAFIPDLDNSVIYLGMSIISGAVVLFAVLAVSVFETNREKVKMQEEFIAQQQIYVQTLEGLQQDVRAFRHDYQNLLSGMYLQVSQGNVQIMQETLQKTLHYFDDRLGSQIKRVTELTRVRITEVKSLLLIKLARAENLRVDMTLEIPAVVKRVDMSTGDFIRCLGILLDNAMEAAAGTNTEPVRVALIQNSTDLTVIVTNPYQGETQLHRLGECGYTTKGEGHGTGLTSYKTMTGRYDNVFAVTGCSGGVFRQELQIRRAS